MGVALHGQNISDCLGAFAEELRPISLEHHVLEKGTRCIPTVGHRAVLSFISQSQCLGEVCI